ncbi:hypothetical protein HGRIS_009107 [Hohenbuehelia grisea]|uniref:Uncharacterized protein n=1 Tax=Hohenbuehelia grisea TaxID=104357 RepID=A0ABR3J071_9AGAR
MANTNEPIKLADDHPLVPILERYGREHGRFITHLDRSPVVLKMFTFAIAPLLFNTLLACILIWRLYSTGNFYAPFLISTEIGLLRTRDHEDQTLFWKVINVGVDIFLWKSIAPLLMRFATGHLWLRLRWGFRPTEIVFRQPSGWRAMMMQASAGSRSVEENRKALTESVMKAIDPGFLASNVGYNTRKDIWVLEYVATCAAYSLLAKGEVEEQLFEVSVWERQEDGWTVWEAWRLFDPDLGQAVAKIFQEKVIALGKAHLLEKWEQIRIDFQSQPQESIMPFQEASRALFESEGVDYNALWAEAQLAYTTPANSGPTESG